MSVQDIQTCSSLDYLYFDYQASTPLDEDVWQVMSPWFGGDLYANPHARHAFGHQAFVAISEARREIANMIGASPSSILFTSGATESNNLALMGAGRYRLREEGRNHVITTAIEHPSVLQTVKAMEKEGFRVDTLSVDGEGRFSLEDLKNSVSDKTALVSVMAVNHEIGVINPLREASDIAHNAGAWFHSDGVQGAALLPLDVDRMGIDLLSLSSHKIYGPKGVGALYLRGKRPRVALDPLLYGGGQERGYRSGTLPTPLCVGFGGAAKKVRETREHERTRIALLRDQFKNEMDKEIKNLVWNGPKGEDHIVSNLSLSISNLLSVSNFLSLLDEYKVIFSLGSACSAQDSNFSPVLKAIGKEEKATEVTLRISLGRMTTQKDIMALKKRLCTLISLCRVDG